jgi:helicase MOV-10
MAKQNAKKKSVLTDVSLHKLLLSGFPKDVTLTQIQTFLPSQLFISGRVELSDLKRNKRTSSSILEFQNKPVARKQYSDLCKYLIDSRFNGDYIITVGPYKESKSDKGKNNMKKSKINTHAKDFWKFITIDNETSICDRDRVSTLYRQFCSIPEDSSLLNNPRETKFKEASTIVTMRRLKLIKSCRADNYSVVTIFRNPDNLEYPTREEQTTAKQSLKSAFEDAKSNKNGVEVSELPGRITGTIGEIERIHFQVEVGCSKQLTSLQIKGANASKFSISTALPLALNDPNTTANVEVTIMPQRIGLIRAVAYFFFEDFFIARAITMTCGNADINQVLQPTSPYRRKKKEYIVNPPKENTFGPPKQAGSAFKAVNPFQTLPFYTVPSYIHESLRNDSYDSKMEQTSWTTAATHDSIEGYGSYWKYLLWAEEHQIMKDIQLYDMENIRLTKEGRYFILTVPGLAEGRPSVLRGDTVNITFGTSLYRGRVMSVRQLEVVLDLHNRFGQNYSPAIDHVSVRFSFSRMTLRTSHRACESLVEHEMGTQLLAPSNEHVVARDRLVGAISNTNEVLMPWANRDLNPEQRAAVQQIANSWYRPLPYIIFGPPGTGETLFCSLPRNTC